MEATQPIVVVISDLHCGSKVAICPPEITISDQTTFVANKLQLFNDSRTQPSKLA